MFLTKYISKSAWAFIVITLYSMNARAGVCDGPLRLGVSGFNGFGKSGIEIGFSNIRESLNGGSAFRACYTHYNIRFALIDHSAKQIEIDDSECPPYPGGDCRHLLSANLQKPYRVSIQGCKTRLLASSKCTAWSPPAFFLPFGADTCKDGLVWREAFPNDHACVTREIWRQVASANQNARAHVRPGGADTCQDGLVWREADRVGGTPGRDHVCVKPEVRQQTWADNAQAQSGRAKP